MAQKSDVIIIGAGISGLAAANELLQSGLDVLVLEAKDVIGGRTRTISFPNHPNIPVDLGAAWIQGIKDNPLIPLAKKFGAKNSYFNYDLIHRYDTTPPIEMPPLSPMDNDYFDSLFDKLTREVERKRNEGVEMSLKEAIDPWIHTFDEKTQEDYYYLVTSEIEHAYGCDYSDLSLLHFDDDDSLDGHDNLMIDGYGPLIHGLASELVKKGHIHTGEVVQAIDFEDDGITVRTEKNTYEARFVICTVSLGVLKNNQIAFTPSLPTWKQEAINRLNMGAFDKLVLLFPSCFWNQTETLIGRIPETKGFWVETTNYAPFNDSPMLVAFVAGKEAKELIETKTDQEAIASFMAAMRSIYGNQIPDPIDFVVTRWGLDPHSYGSYSHIPPHASIDDNEALAKPVGRLLFAGEATSDAFGTTTGAYLSGIREAKRILGQFNK